MPASRRVVSPWVPLVGIAVLLAGVAFLLPPIAQPPAYHDFADRRACGGLPNCLDVLSNVPFVVFGGWGLYALRADRRATAGSWRVFFAGIVLTGFASGYYHLEPGNERLLGDRLAIMLAFAAWLAVVVFERTGLRLLPWLAAAGLSSALWWGWTEVHGRGDLRPYLLMQAYPMLLVSLLLWCYPACNGSRRLILAAAGLYALALAFDFADRVVFVASGGMIGGHAIKHLLAALAAYAALRHALGK